MIALVLAAAVAALASGDLVGQASVVDGDTLEIHANHIRVFCIDAPESAQLCRGEDAAPWRCGAKAANALFDFIGGRVVSCVEVDRDRYNRRVAVCLVDGVDLADWLARSGLAIDYTQYSHGAYAGAEAEAKAGHRGIWGGSFVEPWKYRACVKAGGAIATCSDGD
jgi:endonuclease YncB( thermonuclease family)